MSGPGPGELAPIRASLAGHDWQAAFDAAGAVTFDAPADEAERADMLAEAAWWLGRLDDCIAARELAYRTYEELGDQRRAGQCAVWLYEHHCFVARPAIAGGWLRRARRALDDDRDCVEHGALLLREAETAHGSRRPRAGLDAGHPGDRPRAARCGPPTSRPRPSRPRAAC